MGFLGTGRERERQEGLKLTTEMEPPLTRLIQSSIVPFLPSVSLSVELKTLLTQRTRLANLKDRGQIGDYPTKERT